MLEAADRLRKELAAAGVRAHLDAREGMKPGAKYYEWEGRGVPLRLEVGPRDLAAGAVMLARRTGGKKEAVPMAGLGPRIVHEMERMQADLLETARARREANSIRGATKEQFLAYMEANGGFVYVGFLRPRGLRGRDQGADQGDHPGAPRRGVPVAGDADDLHVVRSAQHFRGGVGQGVLTDTRFADAGLDRRGGALIMAGVPLGRHRPRGGDAGLRLQRRRDPGALPRAGLGAGGAAASDLLRRQGQQHTRRAAAAARTGGRRGHRVGRRDGPRAGRRISGGPDRVQRRGQGGRRAAAGGAGTARPPERRVGGGAAPPGRDRRARSTPTWR